MNGDPDGAGLVRYSPGYSLPNPPCGVSAEFVAPAIVIFFHCPHEPDVAFLYQVQKRHTSTDVLFFFSYYKAQIGFSEVIPCELYFFSYLLQVAM